MNTLLIIHVALMVTSLIATSSSTIASVFSVTIPKRVTTGNVVVTVLGIISGSILLLGAPLGAKCAALLAYLAAFVAVQVFIARRNQRLAASLES